ncbi:hypothetical protein WISP_75303 [Willisornis vidua]|uniref:Uncharacterized protein n=1 Tax=Willisornis vidua TaxID=1566151 RepID=A0ABQ9D993_9PASS|nr:hypothetical protein WISP_75303 [Willisornis vidua]
MGPDCSVVPSDRMRSNGHKLNHKKFHLNTRKNFPLRMAEPGTAAQEGMESPLWRHQTHLDPFLCHLLQVTLPGQGVGLGESPEVCSNPGLSCNSSTSYGSRWTSKFHMSQLAKDLVHPSLEDEKRKHKKKRLVQSPNSYFMDVKCPDSRYLGSETSV